MFRGRNYADGARATLENLQLCHTTPSPFIASFDRSFWRNLNLYQHHHWPPAISAKTNSPMLFHHCFCHRGCWRMLFADTSLTASAIPLPLPQASAVRLSACAFGDVCAVVAGKPGRPLSARGRRLSSVLYGVERSRSSLYVRTLDIGTLMRCSASPPDFLLFLGRSVRWVWGRTRRTTYNSVPA